MSLKKSYRHIVYVIFLVVAILFIITLTPSTAFESKSFSYRLTGFLTEGGNTTSSSSYISTYSFGQPATGWASGSTYKVCLGMYCTGAFEADYQIPISGNLKYLNGSAVSNSEVKAVINYKDHNFDRIVLTDHEGNFNVIVKVPEFIHDKAFTIRIYAYGEIDALYECIYDPGTDECS